MAEVGVPGRDRGHEDLLADPGNRDLDLDGGRRDLLDDAGVHDLVQDPGTRDARALGSLLLPSVPSELAPEGAALRSGGFTYRHRPS
jgi:hypothetical protein